MLKSFDSVNAINALDKIYSGQEVSKADLLKFISQYICEAPMIYWEVDHSHDIQADTALYADLSSVSIYNQHFKELDVLHPKKIFKKLDRNATCEFNYIERNDYEKSEFYNNFLKPMNAYNILQLHLRDHKDIFGLVTILANNKDTVDLMPFEMMSKMLSLYEMNYRLKKNKISVEKEFDLTNRELQLFYLLQKGYSYS